MRIPPESQLKVNSSYTMGILHRSGGQCLAVEKRPTLPAGSGMFEAHVATSYYSDEIIFGPGYNSYIIDGPEASERYQMPALKPFVEDGRKDGKLLQHLLFG